MTMRPTILLVEDNPDDCELAELAFQESGLLPEVTIARNGEEALNYLFAQNESGSCDRPVIPSLVLLDLKLPKINGFEVLRRLRANPDTQFVPVVVMTTSGEPEDLINSYHLGCNSYIRKPVDFTQFQATIRQLAIYWLIFNEAPTPST
jgi:two-component system, response regulator